MGEKCISTLEKTNKAMTKHKLSLPKNTPEDCINDDVVLPSIGTPLFLRFPLSNVAYRRLRVSHERDRRPTSANISNPNSEFCAAEKDVSFGDHVFVKALRALSERRGESYSKVVFNSYCS